MKFNIFIKPNSKKGPLVELQPDGTLHVYVRAVPEKGKANDALIHLMAEHLDVPESCITIVQGQTNRHKVLEVDISI